MRNVLHKGAKAFIKSYFHCNKKRVFRENSFHNYFELLFYLFIYNYSKAKSATHCTEVRFASFLSGGFTTMAVINPPERKLAKRTSVQWVAGLDLGH